MSETSVKFWMESTAEELFQSIDINNDGELSRAEIKRSMQANQIPITEKLLDSIFEYSDLDKNGVISMQEFVSFTQRQNEKLQEIFFQLDSDKSGYITKSEIQKIILKLDPSYADYNLEKMVNRLDKNKDGKIDLKEFVEFYHMIPINNIRMTFNMFSKESIDIGDSITIPNEKDDEDADKNK